MLGAGYSRYVMETTTIPDVFDGFKGQGVNILKCDVEGAESELFLGYRSWINQARTLIVETHRE